MTRSLVYLIGAPGSGKTTLTAALFAGVPAEVRREPFLHVVRPGGVEVGGPRDLKYARDANLQGFGGTDALPMNVQPRVLPFLATGPWEVAFGEGDRLANERFFFAAVRANWRVEVILLDTPAAVCAARRLSRGSTQNEAWLRGRATKVARLAEWARVRLDGTRPPEVLVAAALEQVPALARLTGRAR